MKHKRKRGKGLPLWMRRALTPTDEEEKEINQIIKFNENGANYDYLFKPKERLDG